MLAEGRQLGFAGAAHAGVGVADGELQQPLQRFVVGDRGERDGGVAPRLRGAVLGVQEFVDDLKGGMAHCITCKVQ